MMMDIFRLCVGLFNHLYYIIPIAGGSRGGERDLLRWAAGRMLQRSMPIRILW